MLGIRSFSKVAMLSLILLVCLPYCLNGCARPVIQSSARNQPEPNAIGYYLPKGLIHLLVGPKAGTPDYEITLSVISVPDTEYLYTLTYLPKPTADDNINIQLGPNGLLKTITTTTIDKMPEIIQKIAALVPTVLKQSIPAAQAEKLQLTKIIKTIDIIFDPDNQDDLKTLGNLKDAIGLVVDVKPVPKDQKTYVQPVDSASPHSVYYRLFVPYQVTLQFDSVTSVTKEANPPSSTGVGYYNVSQILYVPNQHSPILSCDIKRAAFVSKTTTLTFTDGVLTGSAIAKPSEVLGFMSIPLDVATAIVAVPASIVKFRIDTTTQEKALVDAQKDLIKSQEARIQELQSLQKAKQGGGD